MRAQSRGYVLSVIAFRARSSCSIILSTSLILLSKFDSFWSLKSALSMPSIANCSPRFSTRRPITSGRLCYLICCVEFEVDSKYVRRMGCADKRKGTAACATNSSRRCMSRSERLARMMLTLKDVRSVSVLRPIQASNPGSVICSGNSSPK
jgi:hypothetical protein